MSEIATSNLNGLQLLKTYEKNANWFYDNYNKLKEGYKNKWVFVDKEKVLFSADDIDTLKAEVEKAKVDISEGFAKYIPKKETVLII